MAGGLRRETTVMDYDGRELEKLQSSTIGGDGSPRPGRRRSIRIDRIAAAGLALLLGFVTGCADRRPPSTGPDLANYHEKGMASWYGGKFHGRRTASGEIYDMYEQTAAHRTLPFGTRVRVTNLENGRRVTVRINDRGPFKKGRIIDLSYAAARRLRMIRPGVVRVKVVVLRPPERRS